MAKRHIQGPALPVYLVDADGNYIEDAHPLPVQGVDGGVALTITDEWEVLTLSDVTVDKNDKNLTVPDGWEYQILWSYAEYTSNATVGSRQIAISILNPLGTRIFEMRAGVTQAASLTYYYSFGPSLPDLTTVRDTTFEPVPIPPTLILPAGYSLRVRDTKNISGTDDFTWYTQIARREV